MTPKIAALVLLVFLFALIPPGCDAMHDLAAGITGAPSLAEIEEQNARLGEAEKQVADLKRQTEAADEAAAEADAAAQRALARQAEIRTLYAEMAQRLATLEGEAADAMIAAMGDLERQIRHAGDQAKAAAELAAKYRSEVADIHRAIAESEGIIEDANAQLDAFAERTQAAIDSTVAGVRQVGDSVAALGVPGAAQATSVVSNILSWGLGTALTGGAAGSLLYARRKKKLADEVEGELEVAETERGHLGRVVKAVGTLGLLKDDEDLRKGARSIVGEAAHATLKRTLNEEPA